MLGPGGLFLPQNPPLVFLQLARGLGVEAGDQVLHKIGAAAEPDRMKQARKAQEKARGCPRKVTLQ